MADDVVVLAGNADGIGVLCAVLTWGCACKGANPACWLQRQGSGGTALACFLTAFGLPECLPQALPSFGTCCEHRLPHEQLSRSTAT